MKKILVIVVVLVLIIGGGLYFYLSPDADDDTESRIGAGYTIHLAPISVPVMKRGEVQKYVIFHITLGFDKELYKVTALDHERRIRDLLFQYFFEYLGSLPRTELVNAEVLEVRILQAGEEILGDDKIDEVIIKGVYERSF